MGGPADKIRIECICVQVHCHWRRVLYAGQGAEALSFRCLLEAPTATHFGLQRKVLTQLLLPILFAASRLGRFASAGMAPKPYTSQALTQHPHCTPPPWCSSRQPMLACLTAPCSGICSVSCAGGWAFPTSPARLLRTSSTLHW